HPARGSTLADHGRGFVRPLGQRPRNRACSARADMVHADGDDRRRILRACPPFCRRRVGANLNSPLTGEGRKGHQRDETPMTTKNYETVLVEKQDGITWLIMNRPEKRNAMSPQLHLDMDDALENLAGDPETQVLVLTGAGEAFCAGQDIRLYFRGGDADPKVRRKASRASNQWRRARPPTLPRPPNPPVHGSPPSRGSPP